MRVFELEPGGFAHGWAYVAEATEGRERRPTFYNTVWTPLLMTVTIKEKPPQLSL